MEVFYSTELCSEGKTFQTEVPSTEVLREVRRLEPGRHGETRKR